MPYSGICIDVYAKKICARSIQCLGFICVITTILINVYRLFDVFSIFIFCFKFGSFVRLTVLYLFTQTVHSHGEISIETRLDIIINVYLESFTSTRNQTHTHIHAPQSNPNVCFYCTPSILSGIRIPSFLEQNTREGERERQIKLHQQQSPIFFFALGREERHMEI